MELFHRERQNGQHGSASAHLERALHTPEYRSEALIWKGIDALQQHKPQDAFVHLSNAAAALPRRTDILALTARCIQAQQQPDLATRFLAAAWRDHPTDTALRLALWQARNHTETPARLRQLILQQLADITDARELKLVLGLLAAQADAPHHIGVVYPPVGTQALSGWAVNLRSPQTPVRLWLKQASKRTLVKANAPHALLAGLGLAHHGGFSVAAQSGVAPSTLEFEDGTALRGSPVVILPPLQTHAIANDSVPGEQPVDVLIPVYEGLDETLECVHSVLRHRSANRTEHRVVVLDDASPNLALAQALAALGEQGLIHYLRQPVNLGFIRNTNRGMALSPDRDVVWLNADTRVHGDWLDRLRDVAGQRDDIASVTPFTNNGELMSFPHSRVSQPMPDALAQAELDTLARTTRTPAVEIETGCGFCLYIKRDALNDVGLLDEVHLSRGYGEETDWCLRARSKGWRHMGATQVFVAHQGGISFGDEKVLRVAQNNAILRRRYPDAEARYKAFCKRDDLKSARQALQRARLHQLPQWMLGAPACARTGKQPTSLHLHGNRSVDAPLHLQFAVQGSGARVTLNAALAPLPLAIDYRWPAQATELLDDLRALPIEELVFEQLQGCPADLLTLLERLQRPYRILGPDDCLARADTPHNWPAFAARAREIVLPFQALLASYQAAHPQATFSLAPHTPAQHAAATPPGVLLIADDLHSAPTGQRWLALARQLRSQGSALRLLVLQDSPWLAQLQHTGCAELLPELPGLSVHECLALAGCTAAASLVETPGADWRAPALAQTYHLPLYAPAGAVAHEAGALPLALLPLPGVAPSASQCL